MRIMLDANPQDAPCCVKVIAKPNRQERKDCELKKDEVLDLLIQTDWDLPGLAQSFGWSLSSVQEPDRKRGSRRCDHSGTDGTITCPDCGIPAGEFISAAREWIDAHDGKTVEDPGYF